MLVAHLRTPQCGLPEDKDRQAGQEETRLGEATEIDRASQRIMFFPPVSFGLVEERLYRSALPNEINYPFLERLGLKTIIYLYPDGDIDAQL